MSRTGLLFGRNVVALFGAWLLLSLAQTAHFYFYFEQALSTSLIWSLRDWLIWFALVGLAFRLVPQGSEVVKGSFRFPLLLTALALVCGLVQVVLVCVTDLLFLEASRPLMDDIAHLYEKRWLQNLSVFFLVWLFLQYVLGRATTKNRDSNAAAAEPEMLKIRDGRETRWLDKSEISHAESAGNYVCINASGKNWIIRSTLSALERDLSQHPFLRVSRSTLINLRMVVGWHKLGPSRFAVELSDGSKVPVGRTYRSSVRARIGV